MQGCFLHEKDEYSLISIQKQDGVSSVLYTVSARFLLQIADSLFPIVKACESLSEADLRAFISVPT